MIQVTQAHLAMVVISAAIAAFGLGLIIGVLLFDWLDTRYEKHKKDFIDISAPRKVSAKLKAIK